MTEYLGYLGWVLVLFLALFALPIIVYLTVKLATLGVLKARHQFDLEFPRITTKKEDKVNG